MLISQSLVLKLLTAREEPNKAVLVLIESVQPKYETFLRRMFQKDLCLVESHDLTEGVDSGRPIQMKNEGILYTNRFSNLPQFVLVVGNSK